MEDTKTKKRASLAFKILLLVSFLAVILTIIPLLKPGFFPIHDQTHFERLFELNKCIESGQLPCRVVPDFVYGYGYPLFNFYAPFSYYLAEGFHLLDFGLVASIKLVFMLSVAAGFIGMYLLVKEFWGKHAGLVGAIIYVVAPYRAINLYVRGALAESLALGLVPIVCYFFVRTAREKDKIWMCLASLFYGLVIITHTITGSIFTGFLLLSLGIGGVLVLNKKVKLNIKKIIMAVVLALLVSSFFWVPAFFEMSLVRTGTMTSGILDFHLHFPKITQIIYSPWTYGGSGTNFGISASDMSFQLGVVNWLVLAVCLAVAVFSVVKKRKMSKVFFFGLLYFFISLLLVTSKSKLIWENVPYLSYVQFPWRFLGWTTFFSAILAGFLVNRFKKRSSFLALAIILLVVLLNFNYFRPKEQIDFSPKDRLGESDLVESTGVSDEYLPKWVGKKPEKSAEYLVEGREIKVNNLVTNYYKTNFDYELSEKERVFVNYIYYPGFVAYLDGKEISIDYQNKNGLISFVLPKGKGEVRVEFGEMPLRRAVNYISLFTFLGLVVIMVREVRRGKKWVS